MTKGLRNATNSFVILLPVVPLEEPKWTKKFNATLDDNDIAYIAGLIHDLHLERMKESNEQQRTWNSSSCETPQIRRSGAISITHIRDECVTDDSASSNTEESYTLCVSRARANKIEFLIKWLSELE